MAVVRLFGAFEDMAGWSDKDLPVSTLGEAMAAAAGDRSDLADRLAHRSTLVIVNAVLLAHTLRGPDLPLGADDEVAFGPPVSGG